MNYLLAAFVALSLSITATAECPVNAMNDEAVLSEIAKAGGCWMAAHLAKECSLGSNRDLSSAFAAINVCKKATPQLSEVEEGIYSGMFRQCDRKYENELGSMYRSATAFCKLRVAETFYALFSPVDF